MAPVEYQKVELAEGNIQAYTAEVVARTLDGWAIAKTNPGDVSPFGNGFFVDMYRDENTVEALRQASVGIDAKPKLTRAEILAKARANIGKSKLDTTTIQEE